MVTTSIQSKIAEIQKRIQEYHEHKNDSYAYYVEEIDAVREIRIHAVEDIEFLLAQINYKSQ